MEQTVNFVESLNVKKIRRVGGKNHVERFVMPQKLLWVQDFSDPFEPVNCEVQEQRYPIIRFCESNKPDLFVAYSEEVEQLIGIPFKVMNESLMAANTANDALRGILYGYRTMRLWDRVRFLFGWKPERHWQETAHA